MHFGSVLTKSFPSILAVYPKDMRPLLSRFGSDHQKNKSKEKLLFTCAIVTEKPPFD
jgi:hypothetical protein